MGHALAMLSTGSPRTSGRRRIVISVFSGFLAGLVGLASSLDQAAAQSLEETLAAAYSGNPTLLSRRAQLRAVNEGVPQELSNWRPNVSVNGSIGVEASEVHSSGDGFERSYPRGAELEVRQFLYRGGRTVAGTSRAEAEILAERATLTSVEQDVLLQAVTAYMDVWRDQAVLELTRNNEQVLARQLEATQDRFEVGEVTLTDVAQSESRLSRARAARIEAEGFLATSRAVYEQVVGFYPGILAQPGPVAGMPEDRESIIASAEANNPAIVAAGFNEDAAGHAVRQVTGELLPTVSVVGSLSYTEGTSTTGAREDSGSLVAVLEIPLYQRGAVSSRVREAKQVSNQRRIEIEEARRAARQQSIDAWETLVTSRAQVESFSEEVRATEIALDGVRQESEVGARTILDVLDAEQELLDASVNLVRSQRDEVVANYAALAAMGRLTAADLGLPVEIYDPETDYQAVRNKWYGLSAPGASE